MDHHVKGRAFERARSIIGTWYGSPPALPRRIPEAKLQGQQVDLIVMCNVLHEIEPENWQEVFRDCHQALLPEGGLVVIEDQLPPVGELPHGKGFFVFDHVEMRALSAVRER